MSALNKYNFVRFSTIYKSVRTETFTKNNCQTGSGSEVEFSKTYVSYTSQSDANLKASSDTLFDVEGQQYANDNGICTGTPELIYTYQNNNFITIDNWFLDSGTGTLTAVNNKLHLVPSHNSQIIDLRRGANIEMNFITSNIKVEIWLSSRPTPFLNTISKVWIQVDGTYKELTWNETTGKLTADIYDLPAITTVSLLRFRFDYISGNPSTSDIIDISNIYLRYYKTS